MKQFIADIIAQIPEEERESAAAFMEWFDNDVCSQEMMAKDPKWRQYEHDLYRGWKACENWMKNK